MARNRKYSEADHIRGLTAYALCGGDAVMAGKEVGIPADTLRGWVEKEPHLIAAVRTEHRAEEAERAAQRYLKTAEKARAQAENSLATASARDAATVAGILTDKALALRNAGKQIHTHTHVNLADLDEEIRKLLAGGFVLEGTVEEVAPVAIDAAPATDQ